ncbi:MAG: SDR family NAD(P)-dependent oxidoreductase, partial [Actinobacteria bacterium]|nr:SDR family NAD(P)-dependent oxidoreductase [Actinomycetota bacterium]
MSEFSGKVAVVTGSSSGIGEAIALRLGELGASVVVNSANSVEAGKAVAAKIGANAHYVQADISDKDAGQHLLDETISRFGKLDILINNSGVSTTQRLADVTPDDFDYVMNTNCRGAFFVAQEVAKRMIARSRGAAPGTFTGGRIVNIASVAGLRVLSQIGVYA